MAMLSYHHLCLALAPLTGRPNYVETAASSFMLDSSIKSSMILTPALHLCSPYSYPFSQVRCNNTYSGYPIHTAPSSNYNPNDPSAIEEQLALQMQMDPISKHAPYTKLFPRASVLIDEHPAPRAQRLLRGSSTRLLPAMVPTATQNPKMTSIYSISQPVTKPVAAE
ncbi:hypothetical protein DEU56DRAFT_910482 [Suillus clintonianus]|uniref:uncharacterized protein n=1 Tax=Suillus clintonianus TaxID=1904413 RepID=UPI001B88448E|nr:uncharacterized protein DEU56DRAFT_910482 [Suillus clintonianus]KAG2144552.1 hypothetical protein DEU56DRAFT_910482 [Suillus clintonianus]